MTLTTTIPRTSTRQWRAGIFLVTLALLTFLPFIGKRDIVTSHEARVAQVARQMADVGWPWNARKLQVAQVEPVDLPQGKRMHPKADGSTIEVNPWIIPVISGDIRLNKPPLPYWCAAMLYRWFGFGEGVTRVTPALLGVIAVLLMWDLARLLIGPIGAWFAALVWVSSYFIVDEMRKAMADPYLAFFTLAATWAWIRATQNNRSKVLPLIFYAALGFGMLAKGPLIFVFVPVFLVVFHICYGVRIPGSKLSHLIGLGFFILIGLSWYIDVWLSIPHALELWRYESIGELSDNTEKAREWWYYLPNLFQISLPWTPFWIMGLVYPFVFVKRNRFFPLASAGIIVFFFSLSFVKKNAYLLPMMPIQTLIVAQGLLWLTVIFRPGPKHRPMTVPIRRMTVISIGLCIAVQAFVSGFLAWQDNQRSPKQAARFVQKLLDESPNERTLLMSALPEESSVYLKLNQRESQTAHEVLMIADDRKGGADELAASITTTAAGPVASREEIPIPEARAQRWKVFKLTIGAAGAAPADSAANGPASRRSDIPAPATSSSESPAGRGNF